MRVAEVVFRCDDGCVNISVFVEQDDDQRCPEAITGGLRAKG